MEVEKGVLQGGDMAAAAVVEGMVEGGSRIMEAFWLETFLWIAGKSFIITPFFNSG